MRITIAMSLLLLALPLAAQLAPDGKGWGAVRLGADYEQVKEGLKKDGWTLTHKLGTGPGEDTTYGKRFGARPPAKARTAVREYRVFSEYWENRIWDITVELDAVETASISAALTRQFGPAEAQDEHNLRWQSPEVAVTAFFWEKTAKLQFVDRRMSQRIAHQEQVDQGLAEGALSGRGRLRAPTAVEKAWIRYFLETVRDSLPAAPAGFEEVSRTQPEDVNTLPNDDGKCPLFREYLLVLVDRGRLEQENQRRLRALEEIQADQQEKIARLQEKLKPKLDALQERAKQAIAKGDGQEIERIQQEMERLATESDAVMNGAEGDVTENQMLREPNDVRLSVRVAVNEQAALNRRHKKAFQVAGHDAYFRAITAEESLDEESETVVLLGSWKAGGANPPICWLQAGTLPCPAPLARPC